MRAELVAVHAPLSPFYRTAYRWAPSLLLVIEPSSHPPPLQQPGISVALHYHYYMLLRSITDLLDTNRGLRSFTMLREIRAHTNIRGNDLADAATKLAFTDFYPLLPI